jgi:putative ABC transport system permease protein
MKFMPYVLKNVLRNKVRSTFTILSIAISLFLVTLLYGYLEFQDELAGISAQYNRLVVTHRQGLTTLIPVSHVDKVRAIEGVKAASGMSWFGGKYKEERMTFAQFATDPNQIFTVYDEYQVPPDQLSKWQHDRTGCVVGKRIARNKGWKLGEKIVLKGDIYPVDLELTIDGIYDGAETADLDMLWFHWSYLDEALKENRSPIAGMIGIVSVKVASAAALPEVAHRIDKRLVGTDAPSRAMTEQAFQQSFMEMIGNVQAFIRNTALAVVFSLVCVAGNAMAMSLRERTREVAVLKAIGFQRPMVMTLILSEAIAIAVIGGLIGSFGAKGLFATLDLSQIPIPGLNMFYIPWKTALNGLLLAAAIGLISGIVPAYRAARLSVVDGLRRVV